RQREAVDAWKHQVDDDGVGLKASRFLQRGLTVGRVDDEEAVGGELGGEEVSQVGGVFDDEDQGKARSRGLALVVRFVRTSQPRGHERRTYKATAMVRFS